MINVFRIIGVITTALFLSCNNEPSLQKYFVDHQGDSDFIAIDIPSSVLISKNQNLSPDEKRALNSIKKISLLALPQKGSNQTKVNEESKMIDTILSRDKSETLMKYGSNDVKVLLKYYGKNEDKIDEVIIFARDKEKGLALVRVLGDDMRPEKIAGLVKSIDKGKVDLSAFKSVVKAFEE